MALSSFLGRDGVFHRFTYVKLHIARIYDASTRQPQHRVGGRALVRHEARWAS